MFETLVVQPDAAHAVADMGNQDDPGDLCPAQDTPDEIAEHDIFRAAQAIEHLTPDMLLAALYSCWSVEKLMALIHDLNLSMENA